jgi:small-conductance mechanosensitive channel
LNKNEFITILHQRDRQEGISIPFPPRTVYLKDDKSGQIQNIYL